MPRGGRRRCVAPLCGSANAQHKIASRSRPVPAMPQGAYENGQAAYQESTPCVGSFMAIWRSGTHGSAHRADRVGESLLAAAERVGMAAAILYITWYPGAATETRLAYVQAVGHCARGPITTAHDRSGPLRTASSITGGRKVPQTTVPSSSGYTDSPPPGGVLCFPIGAGQRNVFKRGGGTRRPAPIWPIVPIVKQGV